MNSLFLRTIALLLHAIANFILVSYLLNYDITGRWLSLAGFIVVVICLVWLFIVHIVGFIYFIKTKSR